MNIYLLSTGYDYEGEAIADLVTLGTCPYWVPFLRDTDARMSNKWEWWEKNCSAKINQFLFSRIIKLNVYGLEKDEAAMLERSIAPGSYHTWTAFQDDEPSSDEDEPEVECVIAFQVATWDVMLVKELGLYKEWSDQQTITEVELAIPDEDFEDLHKKGLTQQQK